MKYSEAIRLGAMMLPQAFGHSGLPGAACANAAAQIAVGDSGNTCIWTLFPIGKIRAKCPACEYTDDMATVVAECLNDTHRWTREQIADWVATKEAEAEAAAAQLERAETLLVLADAGRTMQAEPRHVATLAELQAEGWFGYE